MYWVRGGGSEGRGLVMAMNIFMPAVVWVNEKQQLEIKLCLLTEMFIKK